MEVRTTIFPVYDGLPEVFRRILAPAVAKRLPTVRYASTKFDLTYDQNHKLREIAVVLGGLGAPLPPAFTRRGGLSVSEVRIRVIGAPPRRLKASPGVYVGINFNLKDGGLCVVDPRGERNEGTPQIVAVGENYNLTRALFKLVMSGRVQPGYKGEPWSGLAHAD